MNNELHSAELKAIEYLDVLIEKHQESINAAMREIEELKQKIENFKIAKEVLQTPSKRKKLSIINTTDSDKLNIGQLVANFIKNAGRPMDISELKTMYEIHKNREYERKNFASRIAEAIGQKSLARVLVYGEAMIVPFDWADADGFLKLEYQKNIINQNKKAPARDTVELSTEVS